MGSDPAMELQHHKVRPHRAETVTTRVLGVVRESVCERPREID